MSWVSVGGSVLGGGISLFSGLAKKKKAKRLEAENVRPTYQIPEEILKNQKMAEQLAQRGLTPEAYAKQERDIQRQTSQAIGAATERRGGLAAIGGITQGAQDASLNLNTTDAQMRLANIRNLMQQNQQLASYRDKEFQYNKASKYEENAAAVRALRGAGESELNQALNIGLGGAATGLDKYLSSKGSKLPIDLTNQISSFMATRGKIDPSLAPKQDSSSLAGVNPDLPINTSNIKMRKYEQDPLSSSDFYEDSPQGVFNFSNTLRK